MILVDGHVHFHDCYPTSSFLSSASSNLARAASSLGGTQSGHHALCLTESAGADWFGTLRAAASRPDAPNFGGWQAEATAETCSVTLRDKEERTLYVLAGRQIVTEERIEVLALCTSASIEDDMPADETIDAVHEADGIPVLPWGFGKWLGNRGRIVTRLLETCGDRIYLGDNAGRIRGWPEPKEFDLARARGMAVLPGSDPFPFGNEYHKVGSYGFYLEGALDAARPAESLRELLGSSKIGLFGELEQPHRFVMNQVRMQLRKRVSRGA